MRPPSASWPFPTRAVRSIAAGLVLAAVTCPLFIRAESSTAASTDPAQALQTLRNAHIEVGVLPPAGGRIVLFRHMGGTNLLKENPEAWSGASSFPPPEEWKSKPALHGHHIWVSPQADFWNQQELRPEMKGKNWPPDPWGEVGRYEVTESSPLVLELRGPVSPVTGLQLTKRYELAADAPRLHIRVTGVNRRETPVRWALWSITRLPVAGTVFAPVEPGSTPRLEPGYPADKMDLAQYTQEGGLFSFLHEAPLGPPHFRRGGKAFLTPPAGAPPMTLAYLRGDELFLARSPATQLAQAPPGQSPMEVFIDQAPNAPGTLELEFHTAYRELKPGDTITLEETWELRRVTGGSTRADWLKTVQAALAEPR